MTIADADLAVPWLSAEQMVEVGPVFATGDIVRLW
jgi:hypothetical protein